MMVATKIKLISSVCTVNLLAFAIGNAYAWSSTILPSLKISDSPRNPFGRAITSFEESWIASLISLGAVCGPVLAGICSQKFGRKRTLLMSSVPMMISHVILAFATSTTEFFIARFMVGLGIGCVFTVVPIYVGEIAVTEIRGLLGCFMGLFISIGLLFVYSVGPFVNLTTLSYILMVPIGLFMIMFGLFVPESPYYFVSVGNDTAAEHSLVKLRRNDSCAILKELAEIKKCDEEVRGRKLSFYESFKCPSFRKGITITASLMVFQQFSGITVILSYMEDIFISSGSTLSSSTSTIIVASIQTCVAILSSYLVDKWGRKVLLIIASAGSALPLFALGLYFYMKSAKMDVSSLWWLPISSLILYIITYNFGLGALPWALVGELFSGNTKSLASTITAMTCFVLAFTMTLIFPSLIVSLGYHGLFWFFSVATAVCLVFVLWYVPETKGRSFLEIQKILGE